MVKLVFTLLALAAAVIAAPHGSSYIDDAPDTQTAQGQNLYYLGDQWDHQSGYDACYDTTLSFSNAEDAGVTFQIGGPSTVAFLGGVKNDRGKFTVYVNGQQAATGDQYDANETNGQCQQELASVDLPGSELYTVYVSNAGYDARIGAVGYLAVDSFRITT